MADCSSVARWNSVPNSFSSPDVGWGCMDNIKLWHRIFSQRIFLSTMPDKASKSVSVRKETKVWQHTAQVIHFRRKLRQRNHSAWVFPNGDNFPNSFDITCQVLHTKYTVHLEEWLTTLHSSRILPLLAISLSLFSPHTIIIWSNNIYVRIGVIFVCSLKYTNRSVGGKPIKLFCVSSKYPKLPRYLCLKESHHIIIS